MSNQVKRIHLTILYILGFTALMAGLFIYQHWHAKKVIHATELHGTLLDKPRTLAQFSLMGIDNQPFNNASLRGTWTMIFFGFTHCGYLCPTTMAELGKMYRLLENAGEKNLPRVMMISVDPKRDTIERLSPYVKAFDRHFYGAIGTEASIQSITQELGVAYLKVTQKDQSSSKHYDIDHTGTVMLFNPQGELIAFFTTPHQAQLLAQDYRLLVD